MRRHRQDRSDRVQPLTTAVVLLVILLSSCGDGTEEARSEDPRTTTSGGGESTTSQPATTQTTDDGGATSTTGSAGTGGGGGDRSLPDIQLFTVPECSVVPGGALSGADNLTIFVAVRNGGPGPLERLVPVSVASDTGLGSRANSGISTGSAFSPLQVDLSPADYGRVHRFTVTADPDGEIPERDEGNNQLEVVVDLPDRPDNAEDVACSSA